MLKLNYCELSSKQNLLDNLDNVSTYINDLNILQTQELEIDSNIIKNRNELGVYKENFQKIKKTFTKNIDQFCKDYKELLKEDESKKSIQDIEKLDKEIKKIKGEIENVCTMKELEEVDRLKKTNIKHQEELDNFELAKKENELEIKKLENEILEIKKTNEQIESELENKRNKEVQFDELIEIHDKYYKYDKLQKETNGYEYIGLNSANDLVIEVKNIKCTISIEHQQVSECDANSKIKSIQIEPPLAVDISRVTKLKDILSIKELVALIIDTIETAQHRTTIL